MVVVVIVVAAVLVFAIAAVLVGRETWRLDAQSPRPVFDEEEAVAWVADRLPFEVAARLGHADVWRIMAIALDHLPAEGQEATAVADAETVRAVLLTPESAAGAWEEGQVRAVLELQVQYLQIIGAAGREDG